MNTTPSTEGIKYAGSKLSILPQILHIIEQTGAQTVLDGFSGTTRISQALAKLGYSIICNDVAVWSYVFGSCYLLSHGRRDHYQPLIDHLNATTPTDGWFTKHYSGCPNDGNAVQADGRKKPWQIHNTRKLDGIRQEIEFLSLSSVDKSVALTSLILALDKVDSSLGHHVSYLKKWSPRSYKNLSLRVPKIFASDKEHRVHQEDILSLAPLTNVDLAYFDPPYGSNNEKMPSSRVRYGAYCHLWKSVCLYDKPKLFGKARRRQDSSDKTSVSVFEEFRRNPDGNFIAAEFLNKLIEVTQANWILLSYISSGRVAIKDINEILNHHGKLHDAMIIDYKKNVMANMSWTRDWITTKPNQEFLFLLEKYR